jgi:1-acyl-sn-glycerol-3-phosphate acyltransferase
MVDIEPMLEYKHSTFGLHTIYNILIFLYLSFINPLCSILNYGIKTEKEVLRSMIMTNMAFFKCYLHKVSKKGVIIDKNIMYLSNHLSSGDSFIDPYIVNYNGKFISLSKVKFLLPLVSLLTSQVNTVIFINNMKEKNEIIQSMNNIEALRKEDTKRNILVYPEGLRRPHRPNPSTILKKGFIYHSFEHNLPLQIIHTTNKEYVIDDEKVTYNEGINTFTYYGPKIDPQKLKARYEKKYKKEYTKDDYYEYVYKQWCKIWKKMDKYRIDSYMEKGMTYENAVKKTEEYAKKFPLIEDKIINGDNPISNTLIFIRNVVWVIIYYIIYKIIEKVFEIFFSFSKKMNQTNQTNQMNQMKSSCLGIGACSTSFCKRFSILKNFLISPISPV